MMKNQFVICIAGLKIQIDTVSDRTLYLCHDYLSSGKADICIQVSEEDIQREFANESSNVKNFNLSRIYIDTVNRRTVLLNMHNDSFLETIAAYRKIVDEMLRFNIFLMHGAVVAIENEAYMFSASSGVGKTTHIKKWLEKIKGAYVVNGDKPLIKLTDIQAIACGTPWCGSERLGTNTMVPLKAIAFIERSEENHMEEISFSQAYPYLLQQSHIPSDPEKAKKTLHLISRLYGKVSFWRFQCNNFKDDCFDVAYNALIGEKA